MTPMDVARVNINNEMLSIITMENILEVGKRNKNNLAFVARGSFGGVLVHNSVVEELALIAADGSFG